MNTLIESRHAQTIRELIRLLSAGEFERMAPLLHADIIAENPFPAFHSGPMLRGREALVRGLSVIPAVFHYFHFNITDSYDCPEQNVVVIEMTSAGKFLVNDQLYENRYLNVFAFHDDQVALWREYLNPELMNTGWSAAMLR